jgi:hypothetical protein
MKKQNFYDTDNYNHFLYELQTDETLSQTVSAL